MSYLADAIIKMIVIVAIITAMLVAAMSRAGIEGESIKAFFQTF
jgi:hypothetical protein